MTSQFGFCNNCGTPRGSFAAGFCASCGTSLPSLAAAAVPPPPPQTWGSAPPPPPQQPWGTQPAPQGWNAAPQQNWGTQPPPPAQKNGVSPIVIVGAIILVAALAIGGFFLLGGNKGGKATGSGSPTAVATAKPGTTTAATAKPGTTTSGGLTDTSGAFEKMDSFQFKMTLAGGTWGDMLSMFGGSSESGAAPFTMSGTIVLRPEKAADINMGTFHIIEIGGYDYVDMGTGGYVKNAVTGSTSMADSFSPETMFSSTLSGSSSDDYKSVGTESRNGVQAVHYQATASALKSLGGSLGVPDATWSSDVWIAVDGGYPVSFSVIGVAADKSVAYQVTFDITHVNDPGNRIIAPTNVFGG